MTNYIKLHTDLLDGEYTEVWHDEPKPNYVHNAPHRFQVVGTEDRDTLALIRFQEGAIKEHGVNGVTNEDLIAMIMKRIECFQETKFACDDNEEALKGLRKALYHLTARTRERKARGVEGTTQV
ncbi:hypothetical protein MG295_00147 [Bacillus phage vB_BcgM]|nr:hypothetical protein MG295_00147 [Bacillus phage vB_BcgM]